MRLDAYLGTLGLVQAQWKISCAFCRVPGVRGARWDNLDQDQEAAQLAKLREWSTASFPVWTPAGL